MRRASQSLHTRIAALYRTSHEQFVNGQVSGWVQWAWYDDVGTLYVPWRIPTFCYFVVVVL